MSNTEQQTEEQPQEPQKPLQPHEPGFWEFHGKNLPQK